MRYGSPSRRDHGTETITWATRRRQRTPGRGGHRDLEGRRTVLGEREAVDEDGAREGGGRGARRHVARQEQGRAGKAVATWGHGRPTLGSPIDLSTDRVARVGAGADAGADRGRGRRTGCAAQRALPPSIRPTLARKTTFFTQEDIPRVAQPRSAAGSRSTRATGALASQPALTRRSQRPLHQSSVAIRLNGLGVHFREIHIATVDFWAREARSRVKRRLVGRGTRTPDCPARSIPPDLVAIIIL